MRRCPSLEPRRKPGESYGKETRNGGPCNVSACDGPHGHTHVHHRQSVSLTLRRIFRIILVTMSTRVHPSRDQSAQAFHVFTALFPPPQIKTRTYVEGLGPRLYLSQCVCYLEVPLYIHVYYISMCGKTWQVYCELQPLRFLDRELFPLLVFSTRKLAKFIGQQQGHVTCDDVI